MMIRVYMRDGRTCYRLKRRADLAQLVGREPWDDEKTSISAEVTYGVGLLDSPAAIDNWWSVGLRFIAKGSISHVEVDRPQAETEKGAA